MEMKWVCFTAVVQI